MDIEPQAFSVEEFCEAHRISRGSFYTLKSEGKAPEVMRVGRRVLIPVEAASAWRLRMAQPFAA